ncbi:amidotransferase 1, exosortase A system-associated [soil metagenome]
MMPPMRGDASTLDARGSLDHAATGRASHPMCGIVGFIYSDRERPAEREILEAMNRAILHRGPDEDGVLLDANAALAMRRLAIVDLHGGSQPIFNEDRTIATVFNGEIYNFQPLRAELESHGHRFESNCDTEVLVHGFEQWGAAGLCRRLNGMFAFAIWDIRNRKLILARDRAGKKPLHLHYRPNLGLIFGSEIKALLAHPLVPREINHAALWHYLSLQATPEPHSAFAQITKLPPAHFLEWTPGAAPRMTRYWTNRYEPKRSGSEGELAEELREVLGEAVKRRLIADVPLGAFLSGGIDSSIIVGLMAAESSRPVKTFTIDFEEKNFSEAAHARAVSRHFSTEHVEEVESWDVREVLLRIVDAVDEPFADPAALPTWHLSQVARRHVTVALNGDGGDETHGGYQRHLMDQLALPANWIADSPLSSPAASAWRALTGMLPVRRDLPPEKNWTLGVQRLAQAMEIGPTASLLRWSSYFTEPMKHSLATPEFRQRSGARSTADLFRAAAKRSGARNQLDRTLAADFPLYLSSVLLVKADRMTMAHSLEGRSPFLDVEHMEFAASLPSRMKIHGMTQKYLLKKAFAKMLPPEIISRPKQGFAVPVSQWFRGPLRKDAKDILLSPEARRRGLFHPRAVQRLLSDHSTGAADHGKRLWALLMLELWFLRYFPG